MAEVCALFRATLLSMSNTIDYIFQVTYPSLDTKWVISSRRDLVRCVRSPVSWHLSVTLWNTSAWSSLVSLFWKGPSCFCFFSCKAFPVWISFHNCGQSFLSVCCEDDIAECSAAKDSPPIAFCSHVLSSYWSCLCCLAGEIVCVAKSHCEWPPHPWPGQSCHLCNGYNISAPLFMLSNCATLALPSVSSPTLSSSNYSIIGVI